MMSWMVLAAAEGTSGSLTLVFVFLVAGLLAAAGGYVVGNAIGQSDSGALGNAVGVARQRLDVVAQRLRALSSQLVAAGRGSAQAGNVLVLASRVSGSANELGGLERRVARDREVNR